MSYKTVDTIRRTGNAQSPTRYLDVIQGEGKHASRATLGTAIEKLKGPEKFRHGSLRKPIEQYGFKVGKTTVERFADAAAIVLKKHHVLLSLPEASDVQEYVRKAYRIIRGEENLRVIENVPAEWGPAVEMVEAQTEEPTEQVA